MATKKKNNSLSWLEDLSRTFRSGIRIRHKVPTAIAGKTASDVVGHLSSKNYFYMHPNQIYGTYDRMIRYCITGDTLIATNNEQGFLTMKEVVDKFESGEQVYVFSYDKENCKTVLAPVEKAWKTKNDQIVEVHLDSGAVIRCTKDHPFMLRDGSYCEAQNLKENTALMPFIRRFYGNDKYDHLYRTILDNTHPNGRYEHRIVAEYKYTNIPEGYHVHHIDHNILNNSISNIELMEASRHLSYHAKETNNRRFSNPEEREKMSNFMSSRWEEGGDLRENVEKNQEKIKQSEGWKKTQVLLAERNKSKNPPGKGNKGRQDQKNLDNANADKDFTFQDICNAYSPGMSLPELCKKLNQTKFKIKKRLLWEGYSSWEDFKQRYKNHKVSKVVITDTYEDVYDLTVPKYHNFAAGSTVEGPSESKDKSKKCLDFIYLHNSDFAEMEFTPECASALDIYAEECTSRDENGHVLKVVSNNSRIKDILESFFSDVISIDHNIFSWVRNLPVRQDSIIPLLDGRKVKISEIPQLLEKEGEVWTYSVQDETHKIVPGKIIWCGKTRENEPIFRIHLDDGTFVDTSADHEFILRDGSKQAAENLAPGTSLMPFYTKASDKKSGDTLDGYEKIYNPSSNRFEYTHRLISRSEACDLNLNRKNIINEIRTSQQNKHAVVHHVDFNKLNNSPQNLQWMGDADHIKLHADHCVEILHTEENTKKRLKGIDRYLRSDERRKRLSEEMSGIYPEPFKKYNNSDLHKEHNKIRSEAMVEFWNNSENSSSVAIAKNKMSKSWTEERRSELAQQMSISFDERCISFVREAFRSSEKYLSANKIANKLSKDENYVSYLKKINSDSIKDIDKFSKSGDALKHAITKIYKKPYLQAIEEDVYPDVVYLKNFDHAKKAKETALTKIKRNHKVVNVEKLEQTDDVYCMTVVGPSESGDRHNFPILSVDSEGNNTGNGVFVSNCKYGDFFLFVDIHPSYGVTNVFPIPVDQIEREEGYDNNDPFAVRFNWITNGNQHLENHQVIHFRLLGNDSFLPYGSSLLEPSRRIWRQLCVNKGELVLSKDGYIPIENVKSGDEVYSWDPKTSSFKATRVVAQKHMGKQDVYEVRTSHRSVKVTDKHGLMIFDGNEHYYKRACEIEIGKDMIPLPVKQDGKSVITITMPSSEYAVSLNEPCSYNSNGVMDLIRSCGTDASDKNAHAFLVGKRRVSFDDMTRLSEEFNIDIGSCDIFSFNSKKRSIVDKNLNFSIDESFARLFGFLLGDGWVGEKRVGFADGIDEIKNSFYRNLLESFSKSKSHVTPPIKGERGGQTNVFSQEFASILRHADFHTGCENKKVPNWAFSASLDLRRALIRGYFDADGGDADGRVTSISKNLLIGIRELAMMSGIPCGEVKPDREANTDESGVKRQDSYRLYLNMNEGKWSDETTYEKVISYSLFEENSDTYDIQVEDDLHNFIVSGIVSHNTLLEDAVMVYRLVRSPERRVFKIDVGNIPPEHVDAYVEKVKSKMKRQIVTNERTGRIDLRYSAMPIHKDSPIPLLDGRTISIENLAKEYDDGKENWVYSIQDDTHNVVPGKVIWCGKNYEADLLVKVTLDNDSYILSAPEHPFMLRDGNSLPAKDLKPNMALMPFYRNISKREDSKGRKLIGYEKVYNVGTQSYEWTHKIVAKDVYKEKFNVTKNPVIHHKSPWQKNNKLNNHPSNLEVMNFHEHAQWHRDNIKFTLLTEENLKANSKRLKELNKNSSFQKKRLAALSEYNNSEKTKNAAAKRINEYNNSDLHTEHNELRSSNMLERWSNEDLSNELKESMSLSFDEEVFSHIVRVASGLSKKRISADDFCNKLKEDNEFINYIKSQNKDNKRDELKSIHRHRVLSWIRQFSNYNKFRPFYDACQLISEGLEPEFAFNDGCEIISLNRDNLYKEAKKFDIKGLGKLSKNKFNLILEVAKAAQKQSQEYGYLNHKVKSIEFMECEGEDVYCMTVVGPNGEHDRHNFSTLGRYGDEKICNNGIFILNTIEDDYYIPVRGDRGSDISTLAGGQYTGDIQDIEYMQGKLFAALKIPRSYLGYNEGETAGSTLSQIDIRFNKMIQRIQRVVESELKKLAMIHLYTFGFRGEELVDFDLKLAASSVLSVQQNQEIWRSRFELMSNLPDSVSERWAMKTIMGFDDDELEEMFKDKIRTAEEQIIIDTISSGAGEEGLGGGGGGSFGGGGGFGLGDLGGTGGDVDDIFSDDFAEDDTGTDIRGGDFTGGSGPAGSEVEDLFSGEEDIFSNQLGPFGPDGSVLAKDKDKLKQFARRRRQQAIKNAITYSKRNQDMEEEDSGLEPVQRTGDSGRKNAPGQGRKRNPGNSPDIRSGDGTGKRHISTKTGRGNPVVKRNRDELISDRFKRKLRTNTIQNKELQSLSNSLQSAFRENLLEEKEFDSEELFEQTELTEDKNNQTPVDEKIINEVEEDIIESPSESGENEDA